MAVHKRTKRVSRTKKTTQKKKTVTKSGAKKKLNTSQGKKSLAKFKSAAKVSGPVRKQKILESYTYNAGDIPISIAIKQVPGEYVNIYELTISSITSTTETLLIKIRDILVKKVNLGIVDIADSTKSTIVEDKFKDTISVLIDNYFPAADEKTKGFLTSYLILNSLGLGKIEIIMDDNQLEEVVVNAANEPAWVFHRKYGWLKTNVFMATEDKTKHYATMIGRRVGRQFNILEPLLDAYLNEGDRVNATMSPISTAGNTLTIRKFSRDPWTITKFLKARTMSTEAAALMWLSMQFELSAIVAGGTASGKTSTLNCLACFFPPNQRIVSIEDTRELRLPSFLHWVPLSTRVPNAEGRGEVSMEDLLVNSLRMRPDRILVGEIRRKREAETLFEAIHTGHSCYATFHANNSQEAVDRLTNPPISVPKTMLPAISMLIMQFRNRRTGFRRTLQVAEINSDAEPNNILRYDAKKDILVHAEKSKTLYKTLGMYTGYSMHEIQRILKTKEEVLKYLVKHDLTAIEQVGKVMAEYYTNYDDLIKIVKSGKRMQGV